MNSAYRILEQRFNEKNTLEHIIALIDLDGQLNAPASAANGRGEQKTLLELKIHAILTLPDWGEIFDKLDAAADLDVWQNANVRKAREEVEEASVLPAELVEQLAKARNDSVAVWFKARKENDFDAFRPHLERLVDLQRQAAVLKNPQNPYDAMLDSYESGMTQDFINPLFDDLKTFLPDFIDKVRSRAPQKTAEYENARPVSEQIAFCKELMKRMGFDFNRGRLDVSTTAFCTTLGKDDIRIVSHFSQQNPMEGIAAVMHETGHALYEMNLPYAYMNQPVGQQRGMAMHESQSLLMEIGVLHSTEYLKWLAEQLGEKPETMRAKVQSVRPSLIRIYADEVTYPLHIILRYELEKAMIAGDLQVKDLPAAWNDKMRELLGVVPETNAKGCLQDIHWADGNFGYFPDYTLGAVAAAQFLRAAEAAVPKIDERLEAGDFAPLNEWLTNRVRTQASLRPFKEAVLFATGKNLSTLDFKELLKNRYLP